MPYEPTRDEIEALEQAIHAATRRFIDWDVLRWILSRFVRREEHERVVARCATCSACTPDATPKGDGGATIGYGWHMNYGDGSRDRDGLSALGNHVARLRASDGVSEAEERDSNAAPVTPTHCQVCGCGIASCPPDELPCHGHSPVVIELGPATLRALVEPIVLAILELQYTQHPRQCRPATADDLLAHLKETKP